MRSASKAGLKTQDENNEKAQLWTKPVQIRSVRSTPHDMWSL